MSARPMVAGTPCRVVAFGLTVATIALLSVGILSASAGSVAAQGFSNCQAVAQNLPQARFIRASTAPQPTRTDAEAGSRSRYRMSATPHSASSPPTERRSRRILPATPETASYPTS